MWHASRFLQEVVAIVFLFIPILMKYEFVTCMFIHLANCFKGIHCFKLRKYFGIKTDEGLSLKSFHASRGKASMMIWRFDKMLYLLCAYYISVNRLSAVCEFYL